MIRCTAFIKYPRYLGRYLCAEHKFNVKRRYLQIIVLHSKNSMVPKVGLIYLIPNTDIANWGPMVTPSWDIRVVVMFLWRGSDLYFELLLYLLDVSSNWEM